MTDFYVQIRSHSNALIDTMILRGINGTEMRKRATTQIMAWSGKENYAKVYEMTGVRPQDGLKYLGQIRMQPTFYWKDKRGTQRFTGSGKFADSKRNMAGL